MLQLRVRFPWRLYCPSQHEIATTVNNSHSKQPFFFFFCLDDSPPSIPTPTWEILHAGTEVRYATAIDAHHLKCTPLQNPGHCVIGTYLEGPSLAAWSPAPAISETSRIQISLPTPSHYSTWTIVVSERSNKWITQGSGPVVSTRRINAGLHHG
ncbi:hypothetical protein EDB84DRAFT_1551289 [Lactarius hengduanensis]|nr:hypothetical protein EDB84DRAFT_1551289 [Lactarius hengduanensis]